MKLELKHLVGYLPYGLKIQTTSTNYKETYTLFSLDIFGFGFKEGELFLKRCKPILHPLSDLTKHCDDLGFVPITELLRQSNFDVEEMTFKAQIEYVEPYSNILFMSHLDAQKLLEWHFDIYGLIENNLAIDLNTLNK